MTCRVVCSISFLVGVLMLPTGCGSDDDDPTSGSGGSPPASGGTSTGGTGVPTGGTGVIGTGGTGLPGSGGTGNYWPAAYNPAGAPDPAGDAYHATDTPPPCMVCHGTTGPAVTKLAFGGTVYHADGVTRAANVEIGVKSGATQYFVYSSARGLYWAVGPDNINWPAADVRMRNATGEVPKTAAMERGADCDLCHTGELLLTIVP